MNLNSVFFPAPRCSYNQDSLRGKLIWIPKKEFYTTRKNQNIVNECKLSIRLNPTNMTLQPKEDEMIPFSESSLMNIYEHTEDNLKSEEYDEFYQNDMSSSPRQIQYYQTNVSKNKCFKQSKQQYVNESDISEEFTVDQLYSPRNIKDYCTKSIQTNHFRVNLDKRLNTQDVDEFDEYNDGNLNINPIRLSFAKIKSRQQNDAKSLPNKNDDITNLEHIPCILLNAGRSTQYIMIYFHGNGEDINHSLDLNEHIRQNFGIHVMMVEYPGYGLYKGSPNEKQIFQDSQYVLNYTKHELGFLEKNIIVVGRSIGCGPATYMASQTKIACLALISPFTSIKGLVKDLAGTFISYLINERFQNIEYIKKVKCPTFILHGKKDRLIPYQHSVQLNKECGGVCQLNIPSNMNHTGFDFFDDLIVPLHKFIRENGINVDQIDINAVSQFPEDIFQVVQNFQIN